jgi:hypothetical protein
MFKSIGCYLFYQPLKMYIHLDSKVNNCIIFTPRYVARGGKMLYSPHVTSHEMNIKLYQRTLLGTSANHKRHYLNSYNSLLFLVILQYAMNLQLTYEIRFN